MQHDTQLAKQSKHYGCVRDRLMNPQASLKRADLEKERDTVSMLKREVMDLAARVTDKDKKISALELDIADRNARIISLAGELAKLDIAGVNADPKKTIATIVSEVLRDYPGVTWDDITGLRRTRDLIKPRHLCMVAVFEQRKDLSLPMIGRIFKRDHTTILAATRKYGIEGEGKQVLNPEKVIEIYRLMDTGLSLSQMAMKVGCSPASVARYMKKAKEQV